MSDPPGSFKLRWRGRITGPHSLEEILRQLDDQEIGLWHEIGDGHQWTPLGEFLDKREQEEKERLQRERQLGPAPATGRPLGFLPRGGPDAGRVESPPAVSSSSPPGVRAGSIPESARARFGKRRDRKIFIALGALLGFTGAHNFYAGYWGTGFVQAILAVGTTLLGFGFIVSWLWALVELLLVHTDAQGRPMN